MKTAYRMLKTAMLDFFDDGCMASSAALAYYTIFSLPPFLVFVFYVAGWLGVPEQQISEVVSRQIGMPVAGQQEAGSAPTESLEPGGPRTETEKESSSQLQTLASREASASSPLESLGPVSKMIGVAVLIFSSTGLFAQMQTALNKAWEVEPDPEKSNWKTFLVKRSLSLGMIVIIAFLLLVSLVLTTLVDEAVSFVVGANAGALATVIGVLVDNAITLTVATLLFAAMYKVLPDAKLHWRDTWVGAFLTALLFVIGKTLLGWYLQNSALGSAWGSAATSMIVLLVWVYYSSLIVLFGAELTQVWAAEFGERLVPEEGAVRVVEERRHLREQESPTA